MHLLYLDESGHPEDAAQRHFVLAGLSVFERLGYFVSAEIDRIAARFNPANPTAIELHAAPMLQGRGIWKTIPQAARMAALTDALEVVARSPAGLRLFGVAIHKASYPGDPMHRAFEQVCSRFDMFLMRRFRADDVQRGMIIFDKSTYESALQSLTTDFRTSGHRYGVVRNLAEVPLFLDSRTSRLIQLADIVAYGMLRHFERGDDRLFRIVRHKFDEEGGKVHGLVHMFKVQQEQPPP